MDKPIEIYFDNFHFYQQWINESPSGHYIVTIGDESLMPMKREMRLYKGKSHSLESYALWDLTNPIRMKEYWIDDKYVTFKDWITKCVLTDEEKALMLLERDDSLDKI